MNWRSLKIVSIGIVVFLAMLIGIKYLVLATTRFDSNGDVVSVPLAPLLNLVRLGDMAFSATSALVVAFLVKRLFFRNTLGKTDSDSIDSTWENTLSKAERFRWIIGSLIAITCALITSTARANELPVSQAGIDLIVKYEVGGKDYYNARLKRPTVPAWRTTRSGVTIGLGYDCGYNSKTQIRKDWGGVIPKDQVALLQSVSGKKGADAYYANNGIKRYISIPYSDAEEVFKNNTLPRFSRLTAKAFNLSEDRLHPHCNGALVSLVFNRGSSMANTNRRREMRWIRHNISIGREDRVPSDIQVMKRHWNYRKLKGLHLRRDAEAALFRRGLQAR